MIIDSSRIELLRGWVPSDRVPYLDLIFYRVNRSFIGFI